MPMQHEYRVIVPTERGTFREILPPTTEDDYLGRDFKPDAEACSIIGSDADQMLGSWGLAEVTLREWRAEDPQRHHNLGRVERRTVSPWEAVSWPGS